MKPSFQYRPWIFALGLTASSIALAQTSEPCLNPSSPLADVRAQTSNLIDPFKSTLMNLNRFELDPLTSDLVRLENQVDPPSKRKTLSFLVRGALQAPSSFDPSPAVEPYPNQALWSADGSSINLVSVNADLLYQSLVMPQEGNSRKMLTVEQLRTMKFEDLVSTLNQLRPISYRELEIGRYQGILPASLSLPLSPEQISNNQIFASYLLIASQADRAGIEKNLSELKNKLTYPQKLSLVRMIGYQANLHYDTERSGIYGKEIPYDAILTNLRSPNPLGVCRDIAPAQTQLLHQLGFKNVYSIAYASSIGHVAVMAQDPDHPDQILQINYDEARSTKLSQGMKSLTRDEDYSASYNIFDHAGKSVASLPSEMGALMMEGAGGKIRTLDPFLARPQGSLVQMSLDSKNQRMPVFVGQTSDGTLITGVGLTQRHGDPENDVFSFSSTTALAYQQKNTRDLAENTVRYDAIHLMENVNAQLATRWKPISKNGIEARATFRTSVTANVDRSHLSDGRRLSEAIGFTQNNVEEAGLEAKYRSPSGQTQVKGRVGTQVGVGTKNISSISPNHIYHNLTYATVNGEAAILPEKLKATLDAAVGLREFGPQILIEAGAKDPSGNWKASGGYQGALKRETLTIAPASERAVFLNVEHQIKNSVTVTASYLQPASFSISHAQAQVGVRGSVSELLKKKKRSPPSQN